MSSHNHLSGSGRDSLSGYMSIADSFLNADYKWNYEPFDGNTLADAGWSVNAGAIMSTAVPGGACRFIGAASLIFKHLNIVLTAPRTQKWMLAGAMSRNGAVGAGDIQLISLGADGNDRVEVSVRQALSATKYVFAIATGGSVTSVPSTITVKDNLYAKLRIKSDAVGVFGKVDDEPWVLITTNKALLPSIAVYERHGIEATTGSLAYLSDVFWACDPPV